MRGNFCPAFSRALCRGTLLIIPDLGLTPTAVQRSLTARQPIYPNPCFSPC